MFLPWIAAAATALRPATLGRGVVDGASRGSACNAIPRVPAPFMTSSEQMLNKKNERRRIMSKEQYKRGGSPFDKPIHQGVQEKMSAQFAGEILEEMKKSPFREVTMGEGDRAVTFVLAKEFGFCWGVERSIELAWAAREAYPDKTMHITNELIHNPGVNNLLQGMDIKFIEKDQDAKYGKRFDAVGEGDVVILPAFGASLEEMQLLDEKGVTTVDTTCPWVSKVWAVVDKHQKAEMTSIIHGKYQHEEAIATASMKMIENVVAQALGHCPGDIPRSPQEPGCLTDEELLAKYKHAASPHFDPKKHLKKIGIANQTTMYKKETQAIGRLFEKTVMAAYGPENLKDNFIAFDTICDATQVRQDAIAEMTETAAENKLDFILVVGGWDSSNTAHLLEIPHAAGLTGYHVNVAGCIRADNSIEHRTVDGRIEVQENFLPLDRPARIGVTSGASTPDSVVQECIEQIVLIKKLSDAQLVAN
ncbi:hypothetical protein AB1Y20_023060 [Prymnesium parvum]|uniref:4-hydroxy-3-methylbut-2-enyl diphosphate reductase n=1 Tax=Prymnesium parvum TaxID=97485 RepID=A0AB34JCY7_PRYPA